MKAIILARVSTKEQKELGHSLPAQVIKLKEYAQKKGFEVIKVFSFSETAGKKIRKRFEEVKKYFRKNKDVKVLLAQNVDRATRNFRDAVDLDDMRINEGLEIHFVQDGFYINAESTGSQLFMWEAKVFLAKQYINRLSDDVKRSIEQKIRNGEWTSKAPIGYLNVKDEITGKNTIILDKKRSFLIRKAFEEYSTGIYSLKEITSNLKKYGLRANTKSNKPLHKSAVYKMINNPFYYGYMRIKNKLYPHKYEPIITKYLFDKCQEVINSYSKKPFKYSAKPFIFRGLIKCAYCGCTISSDKKKNKYIYLSCSKYKGNCDSIRVREEVILEQIKDIFENIQIPKRILEDVREYLIKTNDSKRKFQKCEEKQIREEYNKIQRKLDRLLDMELNESITQDEYDKKAYQLKQRQYELNERQKQYIEADEEFSFTLINLMELASRAYELFEFSKVEQKRKLINFVLSNLKLKGKTLEFEPRKPFNVFINLKNAKNRSVWLGREDSNLCLWIQSPPSYH